ncbi:MAG: subtilisin [Nonlabens sp.]|jgi:subtilisin
MRSRLIALLVPLLVLAMAVVGTAAAAPGNGGERVDVIVVLHDGEDARDAASDAAREHRAEVGFVYEHALQGFSASVPAGRLHALQRDPRVSYVEADAQVSIQEQTIPTGVRRIFADGNENITIDGSDVDRIDVDVAIIDTGIDYEHPDLDVVGGVNCTGGGPFGGRCKSGGDDDHYHGTHVAGTVGAIDNGVGVVGVAPGARLWAVKVLDQRGSGYTSWIVAGIDWVADNADIIEVANMSLGGSGYSQAEYDAIQGAVDAGVAFAVAAGNDNNDAGTYSPAAFDNVLTVSALADFDGQPGGSITNTSAYCRDDQDDTLADFSNWGSAVDIAAPGVCILSTYPIEKGAYGTISGTSMASPHAAGALALLASSDDPGNAADVYNLYAEVTDSGNFSWVDDSEDGSFEPLLDVSDTTRFNPTLVANDGGGGTIDNPPTSDFSFGCTELACAFTDTSADDGTIISWDWDLGDGTTSTEQDLSHTFGSGGSYTVTLTVTDDAGQASSSSRGVSVTEAGTISLSAYGYKDKGRHSVDLTWSGASSVNVDIYRDGEVIATMPDGGAYTDSTDSRGGATYNYRLCEADTDSCSNTKTVVF